MLIRTKARHARTRRNGEPCDALTCVYRLRQIIDVMAGNAVEAEILTETKNVSARGVFFYLDRPVAEGTRIEVTTTFPPHITLTDSLRVRFKARVVRVEAPLPVSRIGVAALIEEYEFLGTAPAADVLSVQ